MDEKDIEEYVAIEKAADDSVLGDGSDIPESESSHFGVMVIIVLIFAIGFAACVVRKKRKGKSTF